MRRPPSLAPSAKIGVVAASGPVPRERFEVGAARLAARYPLAYSERIFARTGFLAGDDEARLGELQAALDDDSLAAVWCARGGYGLSRLLPRLRPDGFLRRPKWLVGFSDVSALHAWAWAHGVASLHAPVVCQLAELPDEDLAAVCALLDGEAPPPVTGLTRLGGSARAVEGRLFGGNLEVLSRLCGTSFAPRLDGVVLLLEEVGERPYRIDRALTQLLDAGVLAGIVGCVVGDLVGCVERDGSAPSALEVVGERLRGLDVPLLAGAPVGHGNRNRALPLGARVRLDPDAGAMGFLDG